MSEETQINISDTIDKIVIKFSSILMRELDGQHQSTTPKIVNNLFKLSKREKEVFYHLLLGKTSKQIAESIKISSRTVEAHTESIKLKMNCDSKSEIIIKAIEANLIKIEFTDY